MNAPIKLGLISDTHGLLRPEAIDALSGVDHIIHAGDVGGENILSALRKIAPLSVVRGNTDYGDFGVSLPQTEVVEIGELLFYVVHDIADLDIRPEAAGFHAVVYGHSHMPLAEKRNGVWFFNPGSAGPRRFKLPITLFLVTAFENDLWYEEVHLLK
ncbi:MAG: metallophosphoesterase family protein [Calditrichia bacterium]